MGRTLRRFNGGPDADSQWARIVMNRATLASILSRGPEQLKVLEISGSFWKDRCAFKEYKTVSYPDYDVCLGPLSDSFDLIIAEQVFEHLPRPYRAAQNIHQMLKPGGHFLVTTPFLLKVHNFPLDCTRWTPVGMRFFLTECGFSPEKIEVHSWGNRRCVNANFVRWQLYRPWRHSLVNEPEFPVVVWALAQKDG
jgi:SAM-dependent methyltransferase